MIFDPLIETEDEVLAIRKALIEGTFTDTGGLTRISYSTLGTSVTKQWAISPIRLLEETKLFLRAVNPDLYGKRITRTKPHYLS